MKRGLFVLIVISFISVLGFFSATSIGDNIPIQIQTLDNSGNVITGTFTFQINISNSITCSPVLYSNVTTRTTDSRGLVSYALEDVDLAFDEQYWFCYYRDGVLKETIKASRVPYAFQAKNVTSSGIIFDSNLNLGDYNLTTTGSVGINTTTPANLLDVVGNGRFGNVGKVIIGDVSGGYGGIWLNQASPNTTNFAFLQDAALGNIFNSPSSRNLYFRIGNSNKMFISSLGNVGINTTSPNSTLHVIGNANITGLIYGNGSQLTGITVSNVDISNSNTSVGFEAGDSNLGNLLTAMGYRAGNSNEGASLSAFGYNAGLGNTGTLSSFFGAESGSANTGSQTTAIGEEAGYQNRGNYLTAVGYLAGYLNHGDSVSAFGWDAGEGNTGNFSSFFGYQAGSSNTGNNGVFLGYQAAYHNTGAEVTVMGYQAGYQNPWDYLTAFGAQAGYQNTGTSLTAFGYHAGQINSGNRSVFMGQNAGVNNIANYAVAIGSDAGYFNTGEGAIFMGESAGTSNAGQYTTGIGYNAGYQNTGNSSVFLGYRAGYQNTQNNLFIVKQADINSIPLIQGNFSTGEIWFNGTRFTGEGSGIPEGAIMAFNLSSCPTGWITADGTSGTPDLRGIFLRGSGTNGILRYANSSSGFFNATYGTYGNDSLQGHKHNYYSSTPTAPTIRNSPNPTQSNYELYEGTSTPVTDGTNGVPRTGAETNPAYYATIYCVKTGEDSGTSTTIWGTSGNNIVQNNASQNLVLSGTLTADNYFAYAQIFSTDPYSIPAVNTFYNYKFNGTDINLKNINHSTTINSDMITANVAGYYSVTYYFIGRNTAGGTGFYGRLLKNNATEINGTWAQVTTAGTNYQGIVTQQAIVQLNAGDNVTLQVGTSNTASLIAYFDDANLANPNQWVSASIIIHRLS